MGGTVTYTVNATVSASASGSITNTAFVAAPGGVTETNLANNSAQDVDTLNPTVDFGDHQDRWGDHGDSGTNHRLHDCGEQTRTERRDRRDDHGHVPGGIDGCDVDVFRVERLVLRFCEWLWQLEHNGELARRWDGDVHGERNGLLRRRLVRSRTRRSVAAPGGVTETNLANNSAQDVDTLNPTVDLCDHQDRWRDHGDSWTDHRRTRLWLTNAGPSNVTGATITDTFPAELTGVTWTCSASGGSSCGSASGSGNLNTTANLLVGGTVTYTVNATVSASASGSITNTAFVAAPGGVTETNLANNSAQDVDTLNPTVDLSITKTDGLTTAIPGQTIVYTIVVTNAGPSNVDRRDDHGHVPGGIDWCDVDVFRVGWLVLRFCQWLWQPEHNRELACRWDGHVYGERNGERIGEWFDHEHRFRCGTGRCDGNESEQQLGARCGYVESDGGLEHHQDGWSNDGSAWTDL